MFSVLNFLLKYVWLRSLRIVIVGQLARQHNNHQFQEVKSFGVHTNSVLIALYGTLTVHNLNNKKKLCKSGLFPYTLNRFKYIIFIWYDLSKYKDLYLTIRQNLIVRMGGILLLLKSILKIPTGVGGANFYHQTLFRVT